MRIIIEGAEQEIHGMLDRLSDNETTLSNIDDLGGDMNFVRNELKRLEQLIPDPIKMWEEIWQQHQDQKKPKGTDSKKK